MEVEKRVWKEKKESKEMVRCLHDWENSRKLKAHLCMLTEFYLEWYSFLFLYKTVNSVGSVCLVTRLWQNLLKCGEKIESWKIGTEKGAES